MSDKLAFLFPGQGSQNVGMCEDFYQEYDRAGEMFSRAEEILGIDLEEIMFNGPPERLEESKNAQVAIFLHSMVVNDLLTERGVAPDYVCGHSLGEYSALCAAGAISFEDSLKLLRKRGELMSAAGEENPGDMAAVIGLDIQSVEAICDEVSEAGRVVKVANHNTSNQIVVSGEPEAVKEVRSQAQKKGASRVVPLDVSGAFHTPLMEPAQDKFTGAINEIEVTDAEVPLVTNTSAELIEDAGDIVDELNRHMLSTVKWYDSVQLLIDKGVEAYVEVGPGKSLRGMMLRINRRKDIYSTYDLKEFDHSLDSLGNG